MMQFQCAFEDYLEDRGVYIYICFKDSEIWLGHRSLYEGVCDGASSHLVY